MRIIAKRTLVEYFQQKNYKISEQSLKSWYSETEQADWGSPSELKKHFGTASIITDKRVVFNIKGNDFRLVVDIEYRMKLVFIVWFGSHKKYDEIDIKSLHFKRL
jgi:mRNA interferase HigB